MLLEIARSGAVPIYGLNYKDKREDALSWLWRAWRSLRLERV